MGNGLGHFGGWPRSRLEIARGVRVYGVLGARARLARCRRRRRGGHPPESQRSMKHGCHHRARREERERRP